jgi:hypothetical protein
MLLRTAAALGSAASLTGCEIVGGIHQRTLATNDAGPPAGTCLSGGIWPDSPTPFCSDGAAPIDCASPGAKGQDGSYLVHPAEYYSDPGWSMQNKESVRDAVTGLNWDKMATDMLSWNAAQSYCATLGPGWRLPSRLELLSLVDYGTSAPAIDKSFFSFTAGTTDFCGSSSLTQDGSGVWGIDFAEGTASLMDTTAAMIRVRCVLGEALMSCLSLSEDGITVRDSGTGLIWQRDPPEEVFAWHGAVGYCESLNEAGFYDWRLPNAKELQSLVDDGRMFPAVDLEMFPDTSGIFWSSSASTASPDRAWSVDFELGSSMTETMANPRRVRCTR